MNWQKIRENYPRQWLLVEAIKARSEKGKRLLDQISVIDTFPDSIAAMKEYQQIHRQDHRRELYVFHTDRAELDITERRWLGIREGV